MNLIKKTGLVLLSILAFSACKKDENKDEKVTPEPVKSEYTYIVGSVVGNFAYLNAFKEMPTGKVANTGEKAYQVNTGNNIASNGYLFVLPSNLNSTTGQSIFRVEPNESGELKQVGSPIVLTSHATGICVVNSEKGFYTEGGNPNLQVFNPSTMQRTGEVSLQDAKFQKYPDNAPTGMIERDGKLFVGYFTGDVKKGILPYPPMGSADSAVVLVVDIATSRLEKRIVSAKGKAVAPAHARDRIFYKDNFGDIYVYCAGTVNFQTPDTKLLRIPTGSTDFDDYEFVISPGATMPYARDLAGTGDGFAYTAVTDMAQALTLAGGNPQLALQYLQAGDTWKYYQLDLRGKTMKEVPGLPHFQGWSTAITVIDGNPVFPISTTGEAAYYTHKNGSTTKLFDLEGGKARELLTLKK